MAASGGHWVKGSFIPAESGAGAGGYYELVEPDETEDTFGYVIDPESLSVFKELAYEHGQVIADNPDGEYAFLYNPRTRELVAGFGGNHDILAEESEYNEWDNVHGVIKNLKPGQEPTLFFRTTGAAVVSPGFYPDQADHNAQWKNIERTMKQMKRWGFPATTKVQVYDVSPQKTGLMVNTTLED